MKGNQRKALMELCILLCIILTLTVGWTVYDKTVDRSGWEEKDGVVFYKDFHGQPVSGWNVIGDDTYYFDNNCAMVTGWQQWGSSRYYFGSNGAMYTGWKNVDDMRCYFAEDGILHTGWLDLSGKRYYLEESGAMVSGWQEIDSSTYYFGENGAMLTGWNTLDSNIYYFEPTGALVTGYTVLDGKNYYFQDSGILFTGWEETESGRRYYGEDGVQVFGWAEINGKWYYFGTEGLAQTGWFQDGEYRYYLYEDGSAAVGPAIIDGIQYYFTPTGIMVVLVNSDHAVPDYYKKELKLETYIPWHEVATVALEPLTRMLEDCVAAGYEYTFNSAYRSIQVQQDILTLRTQEYVAAGYSEDDAYWEARKTVALPGTSEHHLGLAVDVLNKEKAELKALDWLGEHCWEYGFIVRYAADKAHITGIIHEPWHFRYVGPRVSMAMKDSGLCLEEYLGAAPVENPAVTNE